MRFFRILAGFILLVAAASAAELKIKVVDPQSVAVAGAQVELFRRRQLVSRSHPNYIGRWAGLISRTRFSAVPRPHTGCRICDTER